MHESARAVGPLGPADGTRMPPTARRTGLSALVIALALAAFGAPQAAANAGGAAYSQAPSSAPAPGAVPDPGGVDPTQPAAPVPAPVPVPAPQQDQVARVLASGLAVAPAGAPGAIRRIIAAGNRIARAKYLWGGGHRRWEDRGYDCSGSVSYALRGAGLVESPLVSGAFARWGEAGPGSWVTIYAHRGHVYMVVAGLRFDTSGRRRAGSRWQAAPRSARGFKVRHPAGL